MHGIVMHLAQQDYICPFQRRHNLAQVWLNWLRINLSLPLRGDLSRDLGRQPNG